MSATAQLLNTQSTAARYTLRVRLWLFISFVCSALAGSFNVIDGALGTGSMAIRAEVAPAAVILNASGLSLPSQSFQYYEVASPSKTERGEVRRGGVRVPASQRVTTITLSPL